MVQLAANLATLFTELPFLDRFEAAARHRFAAVELPFPYDRPAGQISGRLRVHGLELALMAAPPPNHTGGARGFAALPGGAERFRHDFRRARRFAEALGARQLHLVAGRASGPVARAALIENLAWAAAEAPDLSLVIRPRGADEVPGYFLSSLALAAEIIERVGAPNLGLVFDTCLAQEETGDLIKAWRAHRPLVRAVTLADAPDRRAPGLGEADLKALFEALAEDGFAGPVIADYRPGGDTAKSLGWMALAGR